MKIIFSKNQSATNSLNFDTFGNMKYCYRIILVSLCLSLYLPLWAQRFNSNDKGVFFGQIGYNRSTYTHPDVKLSTDTYKATLENTKLSDNSKGVGMGKYFSSSSFQFNIKVGFYVADKWAIIASYDRYNTFFAPNQSVNLNGYFTPQTNPSYSGEVNESIALNNRNFNLTQKNGVNFFAIGVQRSDQLYKTRGGGFAFQLVYGVKIGGISTTVDYTYNNHTQENVSSFTGIGFAGNVDLKFDLAHYIFLQVGLDAGWLNQNKIKLSSGDTKDYAKQKSGYLSPHISLGFSIPTGGDGCGTCPKW